MYQFTRILVVLVLCPRTLAGGALGAIRKPKTALNKAVDDWFFNIGNGVINSIVFIDLKKEFGTVDHSICLRKLQS